MRLSISYWIQARVRFLSIPSALFSLALLQHIGLPHRYAAPVCSLELSVSLLPLVRLYPSHVSFVRLFEPTSPFPVY